MRAWPLWDAAHQLHRILTMSPSVEPRSLSLRARTIRYWLGAVIGTSIALVALLDCSLLVPVDGLTSGGSPDAAVDEPRLDSSVVPRVGSAKVDAGVDAAILQAVSLDAQSAPSTTDAGATPTADAGIVPAPVSCPQGEIDCKGACVDPRTDPLNCNGCGNVCNDGRCGVSISADMQTSPSSAWVFNGTAQYSTSGPSAAMTAPDVLYQAGSVNYRNPIAVDEFTAKFAFRMGYGGGTRNDGMGFMFQKTGPTALSGAGESLGMVGLDGYGVELDIVDNDACGDSSNDHIGVDSLAHCPTGSPLPTSLFATDLTGIIDLADAQWHQAVILLQGNAMSVQVDGTAFATSVALTGFVPGTPYYFGFTGATGGDASGPDAGGGYQTEVKDIFVTFPTPRCL
jgi:hypothetical protein